VYTTPFPDLKVIPPVELFQFTHSFCAFSSEKHNVKMKKRKILCIRAGLKKYKHADGFIVTELQLCYRNSFVLWISGCA
jgi:hypothetical protein